MVSLQGTYAPFVPAKTEPTSVNSVQSDYAPLTSSLTVEKRVPNFPPNSIDAAHAPLYATKAEKAVDTPASPSVSLQGIYAPVAPPKAEKDVNPISGDPYNPLTSALKMEPSSALSKRKGRRRSVSQGSSLGGSPPFVPIQDAFETPSSPASNSYAPIGPPKSVQETTEYVPLSPPPNLQRNNAPLGLSPGKQKISLRKAYSPNQNPTEIIHSKPKRPLLSEAGVEEKSKPRRKRDPIFHTKDFQEELAAKALLCQAEQEKKRIYHLDRRERRRRMADLKNYGIGNESTLTKSSSDRSRRVSFTILIRYSWIQEVQGHTKCSK